MGFIKIIISSFSDAGSNLKDIWYVFSRVWFVVLPVPFYFFWKLLWLRYIRRKYIRSIPTVLLEITPPREIEMTPQPMELFFNGLAGVLKTFNPLEEYIQGVLTALFSLELASFEGKVNFYIRMPKAFRNLVEAHLYAQYPDIELTEVSDYIENIPKLVPNRDWDLWGTDFELVKPDPYPIKTYKNFEESVTGEMIDPLSAILEAMGKIGPGEQIWFQNVIRPVHEAWGAKMGKPHVDIFTGRAKKREGIFANVGADVIDVLSSITKGFFGPVEFAAKKEEKAESPLEFRLTPVEKDVLKALESNIGKYVYSTKMRFLYLGKREVFDKAHVSSFVGSIKQFADFNLNSFKPYENSKTIANYILTKSRLRYRQRKIFRRYRDRDTDGAKFILSSEELATVYHFPYKSVVAPSITKAVSKRGQAPANLPVG
ncbi:MAG: hypothetical protein A3J63_04385 [Candidatus Moranbacteria bacterium RIFCSPHIGHO2_02_FULL_40_12b]|nr:MAG: hypothetical protein A3J63_04385 [Candidatus Moranbacteria bacterium RIFCSPHIGHO2_02_FULL_40_12b]OGI23853.1 MAG: hypothetical protein A3E91_00465 [Candidatus Moranbacteria bacterium RIFCSPHIGHO2_12_FULL_40_10]